MLIWPFQGLTMFKFRILQRQSIGQYPRAEKYSAYMKTPRVRKKKRQSDSYPLINLPVRTPARGGLRGEQCVFQLTLFEIDVYTRSHTHTYIHTHITVRDARILKRV